MEKKGTGNSERGSCEVTVKPTCYTGEQVEVLEKVFAECPKPSGSQRLEIIRGNPILSSLESKQMKAWFQNRRCCEKQRKEAIGFQSANEKLAATKKLLLAENDRLQKELLQLVNENEYIRQLLQNVSVDNSTYKTCDSVVNSFRSSKAADNSTGLLLFDEDAIEAFPLMATGSSTDWVPIPRIKICNGGEENSSRACLKLIIPATNEMLKSNDSILVSSVIKEAIMPLALRHFPPSPEVVALANQIFQTVRSTSGDKLLNPDCTSLDPVLKRLLHHEDALLSCSFESFPVSLFANRGGLHMLESTLSSLQDINLDLVFCKSGQEALESVLLALRQQGIVVLWSGICVLVMAHCVV